MVAKVLFIFKFSLNLGEFYLASQNLPCREGLAQLASQIFANTKMSNTLQKKKNKQTNKIKMSNTLQKKKFLPCCSTEGCWFKSNPALCGSSTARLHGTSRAAVAVVMAI
jgi:hypothetical protein